jgi:hypothetical protein
MTVNWNLPQELRKLTRDSGIIGIFFLFASVKKECAPMEIGVKLSLWLMEHRAMKANGNLGFIHYQPQHSVGIVRSL